MRIKFLLFAMLLGCFTLSHSASYANDSASTAKTLIVNSRDSDKIDTAGDVDWWKVTTTADGQLKITLTPKSGKYTYVYLYDSNATTLLTSNYSNSTFTISYDGLAAGKYYLKVNCYYSTDTGSYVISDSLIKPLQANDSEPNNTSAQARTLKLDGSLTGHIGYYYNNHRDTFDWYKVTTTADGLLRLSLTPANGSYVYCTLYDHDASTVLVNNYSNGAFSISQDGLSPGTYYVKINCYYTNGFAPYTLADSLFTPAVANDVEPNNTASQALTLGLDSSKTGHIGYYYNHVRDTFDWYKVTTNADGLLRLTLTPANGSYIYCTLYDHDTSTVLINNYSNGTFSISQDGLAVGTYYVKINCYYNSQFTPYTLADSLFKPAIANDSEPNNTAAQAITLPQNGIKTGHIGYYYNHVRDTFDWYKLTTTADGAVKLFLTPANGSNIYFTLYDHNGTTVLASKYSNAAFNLATDGLGAGTYYVKINCYYNSQFTPYTLSDSLLTYTYAAEAEPDNNAYQAKTMPANGSVYGHVGFYYNGTSDTLDWWKINYTDTGGKLSLTFRSLPNKVSGTIPNVWIYVYGDTTAAPLFSGYNDISIVHISLTSLKQRYYYVKVIPYYNGTFEAYALTDSFNQINIAKIAFLNDTIGTNCSSSSIHYKCTASSPPYSVQLYRYGAKYGGPITVSDSSTSFGFRSLPPGSYYATTFGDGATGAAFSTSSTVQFVPIPTGLTTTKISTTSATLNWTGLTCIKYYQIQYRMTGSSTWITKTTTNNTGSYLLTGLIKDTTYTWHVAAVDTGNKITLVSVYSDSTTFTTIEDTAKLALATATSGTTCTNGQLQYKCSASEPPYAVQLYRYGAKYGTLRTVNDTNAFSFTALPPGSYYATVYGDGVTTALGTSTTSQIIPQPTGMTASSISTHSVVLKWTALSCVKYYTVEYRITGASVWSAKNTLNDTGAYTLTGLTKDTTYSVRVAAVDTGNKITVVSLYSDSTKFTTIEDTVIVAMVTATIDTVCDSNKLKYKCYNSEPPYVVQLYRYGIKYGSTLTVNDTSAFTFSNLPPGNYNAIAYGDGQTAATGSSGFSHLIATPTDTSTTSISKHGATLNWKSLSCIKYYEVQYKLKGSTVWTTKVTNTGSYVLSGLLLDTVYYWRVEAVDTGNKQTIASAFSDSTTFTTLDTTIGPIFPSGEAKDPLMTSVITDETVKIYPNPTSTQFRLQINNVRNDVQISAVLKDMNGRTIWSKSDKPQIFEEGINVDVSQLPPGVYFVQIMSTGNATLTKKIVISR